MYKITIKKTLYRGLFIICLLNMLSFQASLAKDSKQSITVSSQSNLCQMYFPSNWGAIYHTENISRELYMTNGKDYCCVDLCLKSELGQVTLQEFLDRLLEEETASQKTNLYIDQKKRLGKKLKFPKVRLFY